MHHRLTPPDSITPIRDADHLDELLAASREQPVLLFKHSQSCGTSFEALDEIVAHSSRHDNVCRGDVRATPGVVYAIVVVQEDRELSNTIARRFGVRHETPQVILLRDGQAVWSASHFRINMRTLDQALAIAVPAT